MLDITVIILASGSGSRLGGSVPKQFIDYKGKPLLEGSLAFFNELAQVKDIILVLSKEYRDKVNSFISLESYPKISHIVLGGETRQISSYNGLNKVSSKYVLIHDAARPNLTTEMVSRIIGELAVYSAVVPCISSSNTIYELNADGEVNKVLDRNSLGVVQTPQAFHVDLIRKAHDRAKEDAKFDFTDDAGMITYYKLGKVKTVVGEQSNIKVTYRSDIE
jgi:2-C-methyl-D-erythritol 4-phosphate cytidylyltransferase